MREIDYSSSQREAEESRLYNTYRMGHVCGVRRKTQGEQQREHMKRYTASFRSSLYPLVLKMIHLLMIV